MVRRMPSRKVLTFFLEGLMSSFPLGYLRTFCPRKSKPRSTCVMTVFFGESSRPRSCRKCSTRGLISPSSNSFDLLVMTKSSAKRTRLTQGFSPPRDLRRFPAGYFCRKSRSRRSSAQLASAGEIIPPWGVPCRCFVKNVFFHVPRFQPLLENDSVDRDVSQKPNRVR